MEVLKAAVEKLRIITEQVTAFSIENKHLANHNNELRNEITFLTECLTDSQAPVRVICLGHAEVDHSPCLAEIASLKQQLEMHSAVVATCNICDEYLDKVSGVETENVCDR